MEGSKTGKDRARLPEVAKEAVCIASWSRDSSLELKAAVDKGSQERANLARGSTHSP